MPPSPRSRRLLPALVAGAVAVPAVVVLIALRPLPGGTDAGGIAPAPTSATTPEAGATAPVTSWSATVTDGEIGEGQAVQVAAVPGDPAQVLPMWVDLGTTGEIAVAAWATELAR